MRIRYGICNLLIRMYLRAWFCKNEYLSCARLIVLKALGKESVPGDLLPFQAEKAKEIIAAGKKQ